RLTPPIKSAAFSFWASQRAAALVAPCSESANTDDPRMGLAKRIGVNRDEQIRLNAPRLLHARGERHEIVVVARQHRAHVGLSVEDRLELAGDRQHDVLLVRSAAADRARVLATMAGVDGDRNPPDA